MSGENGVGGRGNQNWKKRKAAFEDRDVDPIEIWKILEDAIHKICDNNLSGLVFDELYGHAYYMVFHKLGEELYSGLVATMTSLVKEFFKPIEAAQGDSFMEELNRIWVEYDKALHKITAIFMYMDRTYIPDTHKTPVRELGKKLWRDTIIPMQPRLLDLLLGIMARERTAEVVDLSLMRNVIDMLIDVDSPVYRDFEEQYLEDSAKLSRAKSQEFFACCGCGDYLIKVEFILSEEIERSHHYLDTRSEFKLIAAVLKEMISPHASSLVHSGLVDMLIANKSEDLTRMYRLFALVSNGLTDIKDAMTSFLRETGKQLVTDSERSKDPVAFVQRLLDAKDKYDKIIVTAFNNDKTFHTALNSSFTYFINLNKHSPEFFSLFVDDKLRKGLKGAGKEEEVEIIFDKVMMLFRYLEEKDVFVEHYRQHLAKRLLSGEAISDYAERSLIIKLKTECGPNFTSKLELMLEDMEKSQNMMQRFTSSHPELAEGPTQVVHVLTNDSWPTQSCVTCNLPAEMSALCEKFRSCYMRTPGNRWKKLLWQTDMGTADIQATFGNGQKYELNVSTYQMCVLMLFNNSDRLTYKEIEQATEIPAPDLKRCLQPMVWVKGEDVLRKEPISDDIGEEDSFFVNENFSSKFCKVKIGSGAAEKEPEKETRDRVEVDRSHQINAAIIRVLKSRKVLDHDSLMSEVTELLRSRFLAKPTDIKKRIEQLIKLDYLERDSVDRQLYRYIP